MATTGIGPIQTVEVGGAQIHLTNVRLREDITLDEVHLEGGDIRVEAPAEAGGTARVMAGETQFRAVISEPNLNRLLAANLPADAAVRNLQVALLSGKARITGQIVRALGLPFTLEAAPLIENGVRIRFDFQSARIGFGMPAAVVDAIETYLNERLGLDLTSAPFPVWLDALRCEPGRLTAQGRARISWPPVAELPPAPPFRVGAPSTVIEGVAAPAAVSESPAAQNRILPAPPEAGPKPGASSADTSSVRP